MEDFNAQVGRDSDMWRGIIRIFGFGEMNERGETLLNTQLSSKGRKQIMDLRISRWRYKEQD